MLNHYQYANGPVDIPSITDSIRMRRMYLARQIQEHLTWYCPDILLWDPKYGKCGRDMPTTYNITSIFW